MQPFETARTAELEPASQDETRQLDVDLERLVWDPEYRETMRPRLRQAG